MKNKTQFLNRKSSKKNLERMQTSGGNGVTTLSRMHYMPPDIAFGKLCRWTAFISTYGVVTNSQENHPTLGMSIQSLLQVS